MILVIDVGTSSMRSVLFDENGKSLFTTKRSYELEVIDEKRIEQDSDIVIDCILDTFPDVSEWLKQTHNKIKAIAVTAQRSSVIPVDKNCVPLRKAIMWQDTRSNYVCEDLKEKHFEIYSICGIKPSPIFAAPKIIYLKEQENFIYEKAYKILGFHERALYALTNKFVTDTSIASRSCMFDVAKKEWSDTLLDMMGIAKDKLCEVRPVGSIVGETTPEISKALSSDTPIPVISAGGDQQCATLGLGCMNNGDIISNSGTGAYVISISDKPVFDEHMRVNCNVSAIDDKWIIEGTVLGSGKVIDWTTREFFDGDIKKFQEACNSVPPGANRVLMSPSFVGSGTPYWNADAKGSIFNLSLNNTKADFARAAVEGICAEISCCLDIIKELVEFNSQSIYISGGLTNNEVFNQVLCDMFNKPVERLEDNEATALGAYVSTVVALNPELSYKEIITKCLEDMSRKIYMPTPRNHYLYKMMLEMRAKQSDVYVD